ncbi:glycosyltransferase [Planococcus soli]|uniref:glycosyltransferase n=1 Tax=Planococcus soli TaxID=2666072 RepID=UPI00163DA60C|nr:glycosyltransferase [Planococcus soli]
MKKKTILYIGGFELPDKDAAAHRVLNNAKIFRDLGYNVVFIDVVRNSKRENINLDSMHKKNVQGFDCWSIKFPSSITEWIRYLTSIKFVKKVAENYEEVKVIICYNYQAGAFVSIKKYCKENNIKLVADCTEWYEDKRLIKKIDTDLRMKYLHKKIDGVICISSFLSNYYKEHTKTLILPPLIDLQEEKWELREFSNKPCNKRIFVYSGRPGKHKDKLNYIINALSELKDNNSYIFKVIGIKKSEYLLYYPEHTAILEDLKNLVIFLGRVSHAESLRHVTSADYVIFLRENKRVNNAGFPTKFVESITCGTPVITTDTSDITKFLIEKENGFIVEVDNTHKLVRKMNYILDLEESKVKEMKDNCLKSTVFHYKNYLSETQNFMEELNSLSNK